MEEQTTTVRGEGKEQQLSKIAAAINPASASEANSTATQSMLAAFVKQFESSALEIVQEMDDDQENLIKKMVDEITKLQDKNLQEFQKAIGKISGLAASMMESSNPRLQELGSAMQSQAKEELVKSSGFNLTGEKDTFRNRLSREIHGEREQPTEKVSGLGKIKGFFSDTKREMKKGFGAAIQEGSVADRIFRSDEEKRTRLLNNFEQNTNETKNESLTETFKKVLEETIKKTQEDLKKDSTENKTVESATNTSLTNIEKLTDLTEEQKKILETKGIAPTSDADFSYRKDGKPVSIKEINSVLSEKPTAANSEQQEDKAGISKDAQIEALQKTAETTTIIQDNSTESVSILKQMLDLMKQITDIMVQNGSGGGVGNIGGPDLGSLIPDLDLPDRRNSRTSKPRGRLGRLGRALGGAGRGALSLASKAAVPLTIAYGAYDAYTGYQDAAENEKTQTAEIDKKVASGELTQEQAAKSKSEIKKQGRVEKSKAVGGGVGMAGGALAGAALGATVGSIVPGVGTVIGGAVGGVVGGIAGSGAGKWLGEKAGNAINWFKGDEKPATGKVAGQAKPQAKKEGFFSENKGMLMGAALGPVGMLGGALYDKVTSNNTETGKNADSAILEAGTEATREKMNINVPPPTVINQGGGGGNSAPTITAPGGVRNVRSDDPSWLRFQQKRAVA